MCRYRYICVSPLLLLLSLSSVQAWGLMKQRPAKTRSSWFHSISTGEDHFDLPDNKQHDTIRLLLQKVLAKMKVVQQDTNDLSFFGSSSSSILQLRKQMKSSIGVFESSIPGAGLGVFARKNIKAGTIVGLYPVHCLGVDYGETTLRFFISHDDELHFTTPSGTEQPYSEYLQFLLGSRPLLHNSIKEIFGENPLFVDANPASVNIDTSCFLAHLVNDGSTVLEASEQGLVDYYKSSKERRNCVFIPFGPAPLIALVTTRKVKRQQELFTSYGANYWVERSGIQEEEMSDNVMELVRESATDIFNTMQSTSTTYRNQLEALMEAWDDIPVESRHQIDS